MITFRVIWAFITGLPESLRISWRDRKMTTGELQQRFRDEQEARISALLDAEPGRST